MKTYTPEDLKQFGFYLVMNVGKPDSNGVYLQMWSDGEINILYDPVTMSVFKSPSVI